VMAVDMPLSACFTALSQSWGYNLENQGGASYMSMASAGEDRTSSALSLRNYFPRDVFLFYFKRQSQESIVCYSSEPQSALTIT
jgi:hypothetical protein